MTSRFRLGLIINPLAGLGGSVALKGSDGVAKEAIAMGAKPKAHLRMQQALEVILPYREQIEIITASGPMGEALALQMGFHVRVVHEVADETQAADTQAVAKVLLNETLDLLLFAGGDGTARDIFAVAHDNMPVLGVPAGVKIHSGVYGITPHASGLVVKMLLDGELVSLMDADVMDIDEVAFREGRVKARRFGEMRVPAEPRYIQAVKMGGIESDELVLADIAAEVIESMEDELFIMGSGSTVAAVMTELELDNTLLGVDLVKSHQLLIGGQGHILGRGNQQLSSQLIRQIGKENIIILATKTKLKALEGRPLIVDSGDPELDRELCGYYRVITGYHDYVMYQVANPDLD